VEDESGKQLPEWRILPQPKCAGHTVGKFFAVVRLFCPGSYFSE
jgi:hypothetical protein